MYSDKWFCPICNDELEAVLPDGTSAEPYGWICRRCRLRYHAIWRDLSRGREAGVWVRGPSRVPAIPRGTESY